MAEGGRDSPSVLGPGSKRKKRGVVINWDDLSTSVQSLDVTTDNMDINTLSETYRNQKLERLKHDIRMFLKKAGAKGVQKNIFFAELEKETRNGPYRSDYYHVHRMKDVIEDMMREEVEVFESESFKRGGRFGYRLKAEGSPHEGPAPLMDIDNFPQLSKTSNVAAKGSGSKVTTASVSKPSPSLACQKSSSVSSSGSSESLIDLTEEQDQDSDIVVIVGDEARRPGCFEDTLTKAKLDEIQTAIVTYLKPREPIIDLDNLVTEILKIWRKYGFEGKKLKKARVLRFLGNHFSAVLKVDMKMDNINGSSVHLVGTLIDPVAVQDSVRPKAMHLMSALSSWGAPASASGSLNVNQNAIKGPIPSENFISFSDDTGGESKESEVIEIPDSSDSPRPGPSWASLGPTQTRQPINPLVPLQLISPLSVGFQNLTQQNIVNQMTNLQMPSHSASNLTSTSLPSSAPNNNPFSSDRTIYGMKRGALIDLTISPIDRTEFDRKQINVRPVYVPRGQSPGKEYVNTIAKECIDTLAEANEFVTQARVEQLLCQRFQCHHVRQLGFGFVDQIPCINELNRLIAKVNLYVLAFVKSRSICTLYELKECLREYVPNREDFMNLKLGPLQRFSVVYEQFRFPPDVANIPEITSMDILDHFHNFLSKNNLWTKRLELEPFMNYLVEEYSADQAFMLGVRIRSLPLAAGVLKKSQRDAGGCRREITEHFKDNLRTEIGDAFRKFRASMLQTSGESDGYQVRSHYLRMRPELVIQEILEKFKLLLVTTGLEPNNARRPSRLCKVTEEFIQQYHTYPLACEVLHLAICMSSTALEASAMELVTSRMAADQNQAQAATNNESKPPPKKDSLVEKLKHYLEKIINIGPLSLSHMERIEQKLVEDFNFSSFHSMGYGTFLEFVMLEAKQLLEENGGLQFGGSSSSSEGDVSFKPRHADLIDFVKQCQQCGIQQTEEIERALCQQYHVKEVRQLGHGNIKRLLQMEKSRPDNTEPTIFYESTLTPNVVTVGGSGMKVGILGHQSRDAAKTCLHNCPLLEDLATFSQWGLVFEPEHGKLKDFIHKYGGVTNKHLEGGLLATYDFQALEANPGQLIKVVSSTSAECFVSALEKGDILGTSGHLVSLAVSFKGVNKMPLALLASHMKTALLQMHAAETNTGQNMAAMFVLQCLLRIPTRVCVALANQIFLDPLGQVVGSTRSKQILLQLCSSVQEFNQLIELGCWLGIQEWTAVIQQKCTLQQSSIQTITAEDEEIYEVIDEDNDNVEAECIEDDSDDEDDVDKILEEGSEQTPQATHKPRDTSVESDDTDTIMITADDDDVSMEEVTVAVSKTDDRDDCGCEDIIHQIRKLRFGIGVELSEEGQRLMKVQQEIIGRSLDRLSKDLYSKDTHFVLELIQNADDNSYDDRLLGNNTGDCPSVKFSIRDEGITVMNNELGFQEKNIRALCDVGRSTKGKHKFGYIGQKGIGFKSVFRVTDAPEIHSNGYHMRFDVNSGPMGYIVPHWIDDQSLYPDDGWMTHIMLKLKPEMRSQLTTLAARFNDIHPSLLLFLHRLRQITIYNQVEKIELNMRRRDVGDNVVEIEHTDGSERWLVVKKMLDASKISLQAKSGAEVESTEIALAFPLQARPQKGTMQHLQLPPKQPVFAFLPLRSYGFRFIIQGDFDVPSSREDVDRDSSWNQWLRSEIHTLFLDSLDVFKSHKDYSVMEAVCAYLQFVPMEDEVLEFFRPVAADILKKLKAKPCVPTQPSSQGSVLWKMPSQTVRVRDPLVRSVITPELLQMHLNLFYLHGDVAAMLNPTLSTCLGIETLRSEHLFQLGKALIVGMGTNCSTDDEVVLIAKWLACMYRSLDEFEHNDSILSTMKLEKLLPLSDGELVSLQDKTVFYPIPDSAANRQNKRDPRFYLQQDMNSLHPLLLNTGDNEVNSQVHKLLLRLGIKQLSPFDIINHHIIPALKSGDWQKKDKSVLISYLFYIKEESEQQASVCNLEELKDVAMVMTSHGLKNPKSTPVHFSTHYGNSVDLQRDFCGYDWTLLDPCYLPQPLSKPGVVSWYKFFSKLGVEEFLSVREVSVNIQKDKLAETYWAQYAELWPQNEDVYTVKDLACVELEGLIKKNKYQTDDGTLHPVYLGQMKLLCSLIDKNWDSVYSKFCHTHVVDKNSQNLKETETSFSIILKSCEWLPAVKVLYKTTDKTLERKPESVLRKASSLYLRSHDIECLLSDQVTYLDAELKSTQFLQFLNVNARVAIESVKNFLISWSKREKPDVPTIFHTSLGHMKHVYKYLGDCLSKKDLHDLLYNHPVIFVPGKQVGNYNDVVMAGKMLCRTEVWLSDNTRLFNKYQDLLKEYHVGIGEKRTIADFYKDQSEILDLFRLDGKIELQPTVEEYIELQALLCNLNTPKDTTALADVLQIFSVIGQVLSYRPDDQQGKSTADIFKTVIKKKLISQKVFPTKRQQWVSLTDKPLIADQREFETMFEHNHDIHFLDMEPKEQTSQTGKKKIMKNIDVVLQACEVEKLSETVSIEPNPNVLKQCPTIQEYFHQVVPHIQRFLMSRYDEIYQELQQGNTRDMLKDAKFYQTTMLEVTYRLKGRQNFKTKREKCLVSPPEFYFEENHLESWVDVHNEIARHFSGGDRLCSRELRSFMFDLNNTLQGKVNENIEELYNRHDIDGSTIIPDEEVWFVEAPPLPVINIQPMEPEPMDEDQAMLEFSMPALEMNVVHTDEPPVMKSWPPVADGNTIKVRGSENKTEGTKSNIWPPPPAKDYMKTLKSLPTNITVSDEKKDGGSDGVAATGGVGGGGSSGGGPGGVGLGGGGSTEFVRSTSKDSQVSGQTNRQLSTETNNEQDLKRKRTLSSEGESQQNKRHSGLGTDDKTQNAMSDGRPKPTDGPHTGPPRGYDGPPKLHASQPDLSAEEGDHGNYRQPYRVYTGTEDDVHSQYRKQGDPVWSYMSTDYSYDELGSGRELELPETLMLNEGAADPEIGQWGEGFVNHYLQGQKHLGIIKDFRWLNSAEESGRPYDFEVYYTDNDGLKTDYIEVKSTMLDRKEVFEISIQQVKFASDEMEHFHIFRVFNAGDRDRVKLIRITNLNMRLSQKQVKLCMLI